MRALVRLNRRFTDPAERDKPPEKRRHYDWVLRWTDPATGQLRCETVARSTDPLHRRRAEKALRDKWAEVEDRLESPVPPPETKFTDFIAEHLDLVRSTLSPASVYDIENTLTLLAETMKPRLLQDVDFNVAEGFIAQVSVGRSRATVAKYKRNLIRCWNLAIARGLVDVNPWTKTTRLRAAPRDKTWFKPDVFERMLAGARSDFWKTFAYVAYSTGLRVREEEHLRWEDIDLDAGTVTVREHKADDLVLAWTPKDIDCRTVPLDSRAIRMLRAHRESLAGLTPYVFLDPKRLDRVRARLVRGKPLRYMLPSYDEVLEKMKASAKVEKGCWHDLRVSAICNWLRSGLNPHEVQKLAGHSDLATTMRFYAMVDSDMLDRARRAQERIAQTILSGAS